MNHLRTFLTALLVAMTTVAAEPPRFQPPDQSASEGNHTISIKRTFATEELGAFILAAESLVPARADVLSVMEGRGLEAMKTLQPKDLWWYHKTDETLIPYAITSGCLLHLTERTTEFEKSVAEGTRRLGSGHSALKYSATVAHYENFKLEGQKFQNVTVVVMSLDWSQRAMWFSKKRVVVFDEKRNPVKVFYDGTTGVGMT